jgi:hypothetical protein
LDVRTIVDRAELGGNGQRQVRHELGKRMPQPERQGAV